MFCLTKWKQSNKFTWPSPGSYSIVSQRVQVVIIQFTWRAENAKTKGRLMLCASQGTHLGNQSKCPTINQLARSHNRRVRSDKCKIKWDKQTIEADSPLPFPLPLVHALLPLLLLHFGEFIVFVFRGQLQLWLVNYWKEPTTTRNVAKWHTLQFHGSSD